MDLRAALFAERRAAYIRLRGGFPIPLAGAIYWLVLGIAGYALALPQWSMLAFFGSGAIFPLAVGLAKLFRIDFLRDRTAVGDVLLPAFVAMLLFWTFIVAAAVVAPQMIPLILAIGMSLHWPVIGWSYARTGLYSAHSVVRAVAVLAIWLCLPQARLTLLPLSVAAIYLATVVAILVDTRRLARGKAAAV